MAEVRTMVPVLKVADMQRAVDFYTGILGFTFCWREVDHGCRLWTRSGIAFGFNEGLKPGKAT
jgi:catechol 2,3-dioxygenase-like lactoylglutathione lyase family enzyme